MKTLDWSLNYLGAPCHYRKTSLICCQITYFPALYVHGREHYFSFSDGLYVEVGQYQLFWISIYLQQEYSYWYAVKSRCNEQYYNNSRSQLTFSIEHVSCLFLFAWDLVAGKCVRLQSAAGSHSAFQLLPVKSVRYAFGGTARCETDIEGAYRNRFGGDSCECRVRRPCWRLAGT